MCRPGGVVRAWLSPVQTAQSEGTSGQQPCAQHCQNPAHTEPLPVLPAPSPTASALTCAKCCLCPFHAQLTRAQPPAASAHALGTAFKIRGVKVKKQEHARLPTGRVGEQC